PSPATGSCSAGTAPPRTMTSRSCSTASSTRGDEWRDPRASEPANRCRRLEGRKFLRGCGVIEDGLDHERDYVSGLYARLDELRAEAERQLVAVRAQGGGGTHQGRTERDTFARLYEDRIAQLRDVTERLAFGRLQLEASGDADDPASRYIGRIGLRDEEQRPILLDWRVPQASAFYQATAATPLGARARRHLISRGREVVRIEDEIFDSELLTEGGGHQGEGALLAALGAERTGRMNDIVATIQAEQDRIIRSDLAGVLVVQGGP